MCNIGETKQNTVSKPSTDSSTLKKKKPDILSRIVSNSLNNYDYAVTKKNIKKKNTVTLPL